MGIPERRAQRNEPTMHSREGRGNEASRGLCTRGEQAGGRARGASRQLRRLNDEKTAAPTMADSGDAAQATAEEDRRMGAAWWMRTAVIVMLYLVDCCQE